ncbi:TlpA family protein [Nonomuraea antimicrobica]|uniref:TlpA family protein n=1 Tax=Nonomuraea antimicrobica TaxID=561173 RepID=A0ABP7CAT6_9ACTN
MSFLVAAVVLVGALSIVNLALMLAVIRRLRERPGTPRDVPLPPPYTPAGTKLPEFAATDTTGAAVSRATFGAGTAGDGTTVVAMFATTCSACDEHLPGFAERVRHLGRDRVMAPVVGGGPKTETFTAALAPVGAVVVEDFGGPVHAAFDHPPFPGFYLVDAEGVVTASAHSLDELPIPAGV